MILRVPLYYLYGLVALAFASIKTPRSDKGIVDFLLDNCLKVLMQQKTNKQTNKQTKNNNNDNKTMSKYSKLRQFFTL